MIFESIQFSNIYTITDLQSKLDSGYFDEFLTEFSIYVMTEKGLVKINQNKTIEYNIAVDLTNYVKNTSYANKSIGGVVKIADSSSTGLAINKSGVVYISAANNNQIDEHTNEYNTIVPKNLNYAVKSALSGEHNINNMTDEEKNKARTVIGAISEYEANNKYVLKESNKRLMTDDEGIKLSSLSNYNDAEIKKSIAEINTNYVTKVELENKGYLTEHQNLDNYVLKNEFEQLPILKFDEDGNLNITINGVSKTFTPNV